MWWGGGEPYLSGTRMGASMQSLIAQGEVWRLLAPMAVGRAYAACAAAPGARTLCVVGGVTCGHAVAASIEVYHADADVWVTVAEALPRPLYGHAAAIEALIQGGATPDLRRESDDATPLLVAAHCGHGRRRRRHSVHLEPLRLQQQTQALPNIRLIIGQQDARVHVPRLLNPGVSTIQ